MWKLPVLFVCENNLYAITTYLKSVFAGESIAARAAAYGITSHVAHGSDVIEVYETTLKALEKIRAGNGPAFIECRTYRFMGHGAYDLGTGYRPRDEIEEWLRRDPINMLAEKMKAAGTLKDEDRKKIEEEVARQLDTIVEEVLKAPVYDYEKLPSLVYYNPF